MRSGEHEGASPVTPEREHSSRIGGTGPSVPLCLSLLSPHQVSSGLERGGFTFQGDVRGEDFGKFKLERQGELRAAFQGDAGVAFAGLC